MSGENASTFHRVYQKMKNYIDLKTIETVQQCLFINYQKNHGLKIDTDQLNFSEWISNKNDPEIVDKFCKINEDILKKDVEFQEELEKFDT